MKLARPTSRTFLLFGCLAILLVAFGVNTIHLRHLEGELDVLAEEKGQEFVPGDPMDGSQRLATNVVASKAYGVVGPASGRVEVMFRNIGYNGSPVYTSVVYFFEQRDGEWVETESAQCSDEECQRRAEIAFGDEPSEI